MSNSTTNRPPLSSVGRAFDCSGIKYRIVAGSIPAVETFFHVYIQMETLTKGVKKLFIEDNYVIK